MWKESRVIISWFYVNNWMNGYSSSTYRILDKEIQVGIGNRESENIKLSS